MVTKVELEGTKMVSQKLPNGWSEGTKGVGTRYQSGTDCPIGTFCLPLWYLLLTPLLPYIYPFWYILVTLLFPSGYLFATFWFSLWYLLLTTSVHAHSNDPFEPSGCPFGTFWFPFGTFYLNLWYLLPKPLVLSDYLPKWQSEGTTNLDRRYQKDKWKAPKG
jgi:hypothetical protein